MSESIDLPAEGFVLLITAAAQAIINELQRPAKEVRPDFLHGQVGMLDELVDKFENLHKATCP